MDSNVPEWVQLLTFGYVREHQMKQPLFMDIPTAIIWLIVNFHAALFKLGLYNKERFEISDDGLFIKSIATGCEGFMVYADLLDKNDTGFDRGVYFWSLQSNVGYTCFFSIGVTTIKNDKIVNLILDRFIDDIDMGRNREITKGYHYYYELYHRLEDEIVTVKLDCNDWKVSYYRNEALMKSEDIEPNQLYFLAISLCGQQGNTHLKVVETPKILLRDLRHLK